jgi:putative cell wall-binding protein
MQRSIFIPVLAGAALLLGASPAIAAVVKDAPTNVNALVNLKRATPVAARNAVIGRSTLRLSGGNRYATAVEISKVQWEPTKTGVVHLANGEAYADALAMGPTTMGLGPLLLTAKDFLPAETEAELARLQPCIIIVVGGTGAVSDAVAAQADRYADVTRCA